MGIPGPIRFASSGGNDSGGSQWRDGHPGRTPVRDRGARGGTCLDKFKAELRKGWAMRFGKVCALMKTAKRWRSPFRPIGDRLPSTLPSVETILTEHPTAEGPFGAKGAADPPSLLPPALVACAVSDATGRRINKIPVTPEDVLAAIIQREHENPETNA